MWTEGVDSFRTSLSRSPGSMQRWNAATPALSHLSNLLSLYFSSSSPSPHNLSREGPGGRGTWNRRVHVFGEEHITRPAWRGDSSNRFKNTRGKLASPFQSPCMWLPREAVSGAHKRAQKVEVRFYNSMKWILYWDHYHLGNSPRGCQWSHLQLCRGQN